MMAASIVHRISGSGLLVPYYHMVSDECLPHVRHLYPYKNVDQFCNDLSLLLRSYRPVGIEEIVAAQNGGSNALNGCFHLTFDDGFSEMATVVAPILLEEGVPATFFVNSAFVDNTELCYTQKASLLLSALEAGGGGRTRDTGGELQDRVEPAQLSRCLELIEGRESSRSIPGVNRKGKDGSDPWWSAARATVASAIRATRYAGRERLDDIAFALGLDFGRYLKRRQPYLNTDQILRLKRDGFGIGAHSVDHPHYRYLAYEDQLRQTIQSLRFVRSRFQIPYAAFAFPHSDIGVGVDFFRDMKSAGLLDVSFGTGDMRRDEIPWNIQRISFEKPLMRADRILAKKCLRRIARKLLLRDHMSRS